MGMFFFVQLLICIGDAWKTSQSCIASSDQNKKCKPSIGAGHKSRAPISQTLALAEMGWKGGPKGPWGNGHFGAVLGKRLIRTPTLHKYTSILS